MKRITVLLLSMMLAVFTYGQNDNIVKVGRFMLWLKLSTKQVRQQQQLTWERGSLDWYLLTKRIR